MGEDPSTRPFHPPGDKLEFSPDNLHRLGRGLQLPRIRESFLLKSIDLALLSGKGHIHPVWGDQVVKLFSKPSFEMESGRGDQNGEPG